LLHNAATSFSLYISKLIKYKLADIQGVFLRFAETIGLSYLVRATQQELRQKIDEALKPLHISFAQYAALSALEESGQLTNAELARKSTCTPQTMNRLAHGLEENGFVQKSEHETHGLLVNYSLTKKGAKVICDAHIAVNKIELFALEGLSTSETKQIMNLLKKCLAQLQSK
jgi:DNA-binding MarR family transcriptional regulator